MRRPQNNATTMMAMVAVLRVDDNDEPLPMSPNNVNNDEEDTILLTKDVLRSSSTSRVEPFQIDESDVASIASSSSSTSSSLRHGSGIYNNDRNRQRRQRSRQRRRQRRKNQKPSTPRQARIRYFILSTLAVILTIACPQTNLRRQHNIDNNEAQQQQHISTINKQLLVQVFLVYIITLIAFYILHGSDPGYITPEIMQQICLEDGYTLLGTKQRQQQGQTGQDEELSVDQDDAKELGPCTSSDPATAATVVGGGGGKEQQQQQQVIRRLSQSVSLHSLAANGRGSSSGSTSGVNDNGNNNNNNNNNNDPLASLEVSSLPILINHASTRRKICKYCQYAPPLRSHHCRICGINKNCIAMFDHHCDFLGTCIGERNHCRFYWFLFIQAIAFYICCHVIVGSSDYGFTTLLIHFSSSSTSPSSGSSAIHQYHSGNNVANNHNVHHSEKGFRYDVLVAILAKMYLYPLMIMAFIMLGIHTFMALSNTTTFECTKGPRGHLEYLKQDNNTTSVMDLPFSKRLDQNLYFFCCQRDDAASATFWRDYYYCLSRRRDGNDKNDNNYKVWRPTVWYPPEKIIRDSEDWWAHPWQNKYWSCC